jgi:aspartyl-tRNA(Asn)/glutamyl-tRNA(Gln) amidotransferase subunit B
MAKMIQVPETPLKRAERLSTRYGIDRNSIRQIVLTSSTLTDFLERLCSNMPPEIAVAWVLGPLSSNWKYLGRSLNEDLSNRIENTIQMVIRGDITDSEARMRIGALARGGGTETTQDSKERISLAELVSESIDQTPQILFDFNSNKRAANFIIGQIMRETKGKYSSSEIVETVNKEIERRLKDRVVI